MAFVGSITAGGAILGAGALGAGASIGSALIGSNAAKDAAGIQATSAANALAQQKSIFDQTQANFAPYLGVGKGATYSLGQLYGIGPDGSSTGAQPDYSGFTNSPDYQFAQQQGSLGLDRYENAKGLALSGGALKDVSQFNQGLASQQYGNYFNRLMGLSQLGSGAASAAAGSGANFSSQMSNSIQGQGQAQAAGVVGSANALSGGLNGVANSASGAVNNSLLYNAINRSSYASPNSTPLNPSGQVGDGYYNNGSLVPGPSQSYP